MAISTMFLLFGLMITLDMFITFKLYQSVQDDNAETIRELKSHLAGMRHEIASYRLSIDGKIEKALSANKHKRTRRKLKEEKPEECKKEEKKS